MKHTYSQTFETENELGISAVRFDAANIYSDESLFLIDSNVLRGLFWADI